jgi:hypothetical protein
MNASGCGEAGVDCGGVGRTPMLLLLVPVLLSLLWVVFLLYYGSWVLAVVLTRAANLFLTHSGVHIGERGLLLYSFKCSCLLVTSA